MFSFNILSVLILAVPKVEWCYSEVQCLLKYIVYWIGIAVCKSQILVYVDDL